MKLSITGFTEFLNKPCGDAKSKALFSTPQTPPATEAHIIAFPFQQILEGPEIVTIGAVSMVISFVDSE